MVSLKKHWVRTDAWRGYYKYDNSVFSGSLLAGFGDPYAESRNEEEKKNLKKVKSILKANKIPHRLAQARTSNVFAGSYDIVVDKENVKKAKSLLRSVM
jgi:hypothetical protein